MLGVPAVRGRTTARAEIATLLPVLVVTLGALELAARAQSGHLPLVRAVGAVLLTQLVPGIVVWRSVRPRAGWLVEDLVLGAACGAGAAVVGQVLALLVGWAGPAWLTPWVVAVVLLVVPGSRRRVADAEWNALPWWWGLSVAVVSLGSLEMGLGFFRQAIPQGGGWTRQYVDLPYHLALAAELSHRFPPHTPQVADQALLYHWFSHAWMAQVASVAHIELDVVVLRFLPVYAAVLVPLAVAVLAVRVVGSAAAGPLATGVVFLVTTVHFWPGGSSIIPVSAASPPMGFSTLLVCALLALLVERWRGAASRASVLLVPVLALLAMGSKGSAGPVLLVGLVLACGCALLLHHPARRTVLLDSALVLVVLALVIRVLFAGNDGDIDVVPFVSQQQNQGHSILGVGADAPGPFGVAMIVLLLAIAMILPYVSAFGVLRGSSRGDPFAWLLLGTSAAGFGAMMVLSHSAGSQAYFLKSAAPATGVAVAWGVIALARGTRGAARAVSIGALAAVPLSFLPKLDPLWPSALLVSGVLEVALYLGLVGAAGYLGWRVCGRSTAAGWLCALVLVPVAAAVPTVLSLVRGSYISSPDEAGSNELDSVNGQEITAFRYLRDHADPDDVVMTNRHCRRAFSPRCDDRRFYLAAYSEHRVLIEGWGYTPETNYSDNGDPDFNVRLAPFPRPALLELNDRFYRHPTRSAARRLYDRGVRWVYVDRQYPHVNLSDFGKRVLRNRWAAVYRLEDPDA